ncbi:MAG: acyl-CoA thioesterase [Gemmatimonadales bacterium]
MSPAPYTVDEYVRWSDVDAAGIICYGAYLRFCEIAETEMFRAAGMPFGEVFDRFGIWLPRARMHFDFYIPARLDDRLKTAVYLGRVGNKSLTLNFDVVRPDLAALGAAGHFILVCVDRKDLKSRPLPPDLVSQLKPYTLPTAEARRALGVTDRAE